MQLLYVYYSGRIFIDIASIIYIYIYIYIYINLFIHLYKCMEKFPMEECFPAVSSISTFLKRVLCTTCVCVCVCISSSSLPLKLQLRHLN